MLHCPALLLQTLLLPACAICAVCFKSFSCRPENYKGLIIKRDDVFIQSVKICILLFKSNFTEVIISYCYALFYFPELLKCMTFYNVALMRFLCQ